MTPIKTYQVTYQFGGSASELQGVLTDLEKKAASLAKIFQELPAKLQVKTGNGSAVDSVLRAYEKLAAGQTKVLESQAGLVASWKSQLSEMEAATKAAMTSINATLSGISIPAGAFKGLETIANLKTGGTVKSTGAERLLPSLLGGYGSVKEFEEDFKSARSRTLSTISKLKTLRPLMQKAQSAAEELEKFEKQNGRGSGKNWVTRTTKIDEERELRKQHKSLMDAKIAANKNLAAANNAAGGNFDALHTKLKDYWSNYKGLREQSQKIASAALHDAKLKPAAGNSDPFNINVNVDTAAAKTALEKLASDFKALSSEFVIKPTIQVDAKGLTAKLNETIKKLQNTAKGKSITITTNFSADGIIASLDTALAKAQELAQSKALTVKTNLLSESNGAAINSSLGKLQKQADGKPLTVKTRLAGGGEAGEALSMSIGRLQKLANERAISLRTRLNGGQAGEDLSLALNRLQQLANTRPIIIKTQLDTALTSEQLNSLLATTASTAAKANEKANEKVKSTTTPVPVAAGSSTASEEKEAKAPKNPYAMTKSEKNAYHKAEDQRNKDLRERQERIKKAHKAEEAYHNEVFASQPKDGVINARGNRVAFDPETGLYSEAGGEKINVARENEYFKKMINPSGQNWGLFRLQKEAEAQAMEKERVAGVAAKRIADEKIAAINAQKVNERAVNMLSPMGHNQTQLLKTQMGQNTQAEAARRQAAHQNWVKRDASSESPRQKRITERKESERQSRLSLHNERELNRVRALKLAEEEQALLQAKEATKLAKANNKLTGSAALRRQQLIAAAQANGSGRDSRMANIRRNAYPWTGNTSFGARTPVALDMAKGMGMMFAVSGLMSTVTESFHQVAEYDNLMKTVRAILQTTDKGPNFNGRFEAMEGTVREVGRKTKFTAPEVAGAARFMAMAGLNIENINAATEPIANLALIGDTELSETADKMTNIMTSFGLLKGLSAGQQKKNMIHTSDVLTNTFTRSNTDMLQLAEAMQYAGPMSHLFGTSLEDAAAMVGVMGNAGIQASMAGTSLRMMYQNIVKPNKNQSKEWDRLGISRTDKNGNLRPIFDILKDLRAKLTGTRDLNARVDPETLKGLGTGVLSLFRTTAGSGVAALLENLGEAEAIANTNRSANGVAAKIADEKKNTIAGLWAQVTSTFTDQNLTVATDFQNTIKQILTDLRDWLSSTEAAETLRSVYDLVNSILGVFKEAAKVWIGMYRLWPGFFKTLIAVQFTISQIGALMSPFIGLLSIIGSVKSTIMGLAGAFGALNTAAGVGSLGAGGVGNLGRAAVGGAAASSTMGKVASSAKAFGLGSGHIGYMGATAVLLGTRHAHPKYLGEYTRRKEFYLSHAMKNGAVVNERAYGKYVVYDSAIAAASSMAARRGEAHRLWLERRKDPEKFIQEHKKDDGTNYGVGAYHTNKQKQRANRIPSNATILRGYRINKFGAGRSIGMAARSGMMAANAISFAPLIANIKNGLMSVILTISRGLGMLISPIGLATAAIGGLAWVFIHFYNKQRDEIKKNEEIAKRGEAARGVIKQAVMGNLGVVGTLNPSQALTTPAMRTMASRSRSGRTILGSRFDPMLKNSKEYRSVFGDDKFLNNQSYYNAYMKPFADTAGALYGKRGVKMDGRSILYAESAYEKKHNKSSAIPVVNLHGVQFDGNKTLRRNALNRITAYNLGSVSSEFASKKKTVQSWIKDYDQLPDGKKTPEAQQKLISNIGAMASSLREEAAGRPTVIGRDISNMRATQVAQSREAYEGMAQQIEAMKDYVNSFNTGLQQLMGMMTFQAQNIHGQIVNFNLPFNRGALDWNALKMQFQMLGVKFQNNLNGHWSMMLQVFNTIQNNAELAQKYAGMTAGQIAALSDPIKGGYKFNPKEWQGWVADWFNDTNWSGKSKYKDATDFFNRGGWRTDKGLTAIRSHALDKMTGGTKIKGNSSVGGSTGNNSGTTTGSGAHNAADQSKYDSKYRKSGARPTQIIFNIDNLCNFNNTVVKNAGDVSVAEGVGKQLSIGLQELFAQAVSEYAIIGESQG